MSHTEFHIGKLKKVDLEGLSFEDWSKKTLNNIDTEDLGLYHNKWSELLLEVFPDTYYSPNNVDLYEFIEHQEIEDEGYFSQLTKNPDGTYNFISQFYNGGTCLSEMLDDEFDKLNKK